MQHKTRRFMFLVAFVAVALTFSLSMRAEAQTVDFIAQFSGVQGSSTGVVQATDGNFYGVASGASYHGQIFRITPTGKLNTIYSFCSLPGCTDGEYPGRAPILASDGNLYGVTDGGTTIGSTVYKVTLDGQLTTLYTFCAASCADGVFANGVIEGTDGNFYGTTAASGNGGGGTIFRISPTGQFKLLYTFCSLAKCADGSTPYFPPVQSSDGNFYGTTYAGGVAGGGVVYELTPSGTYTVLHNFCGQSGMNCKTGGNPSTVIADNKGNIFGTSVYGDQVAFEITSTHQYRVLYTFVSGGGPFTGLTLASDGNFYGMTQDGGGRQEGTIFKITPAGKFTNLFDFGCCNQGYDPSDGPLFQGTNGLLYGATLYGAPPCCYGTIFTLSNGMKPLVETVPVAGKVGQSVLILGSGLTGSSSVEFDGVKASFTVESDIYIKATVPTGAKTGTVSVVTPTGTLNSNPQFVVTK